MNGMCLSCDFNNLDYLCFVWFRFFFIMGRPKKMWHGLDLKILAIKWASENANRNAKIKKQAECENKNRTKKICSVMLLDCKLNGPKQKMVWANYDKTKWAKKILES